MLNEQPKTLQSQEVIKIAPDTPKEIDTPGTPTLFMLPVEQHNQQEASDELKLTSMCNPKEAAISSKDLKVTQTNFEDLDFNEIRTEICTKLDFGSEETAETKEVPQLIATIKKEVWSNNTYSQNTVNQVTPRPAEGKVRGVRVSDAEFSKPLKPAPQEMSDMEEKGYLLILDDEGSGVEAPKESVQQKRPKVCIVQDSHKIVFNEVRDDAEMNVLSNQMTATFESQDKSSEKADLKPFFEISKHDDKVHISEVSKKYDLNKRRVNKPVFEPAVFYENSGDIKHSRSPSHLSSSSILISAPSHPLHPRHPICKDHRVDIKSLESSSGMSVEISELKVEYDYGDKEVEVDLCPLQLQSGNDGAVPGKVSKCSVRTMNGASSDERSGIAFKEA